MWWMRRNDAIDLVASKYVELLRRNEQTHPMKLLQESGISTLRSGGQVARLYRRIFEIGGHDISLHLPSWATPSNIVMAFNAARKHGRDLSTVGGIYSFLRSEWCPVQIRNQASSSDDVTHDSSGNQTP